MKVYWTGTELNTTATTPGSVACIGSAHWDVFGKIPAPLLVGEDVPGEVLQVPGGVALNVALALSRLGQASLLYSVVGNDRAGHELVERIVEAGIPANCIRRAERGSTDRCVFIEDESGSITGISDCRLLEKNCHFLIHELSNGNSLRESDDAVLIVDGNLSLEALNELATGGTFRKFQINFITASTGKALRARVFLNRSRFTLYMNRKEAERLGARRFRDSQEAARFLSGMGFERVVVTDSERGISDCDNLRLVRANPDRVRHASRVLGAGDNFTAAHVTAGLRGMGRADALAFAAEFAQEFVTFQFGP